MAGRKSYLAKELTELFEAAWLDLPAEAAKTLLGAGNEQQLRKAGWRAYDAWVSVANELTNAIYADPVIGEVSAGMMETALRLQQIGGVMAGAFFGNLWPAIGLPTHSEIVAVREELVALREELAALPARLPAAEEWTDTDSHDVSPEAWRAAQLNGHCAPSGNPARPFPNGGKRHVAA
jgi:hypothetical protein